MRPFVKDSGASALVWVVPPLAVTFLMWLVRINEITLFEFVGAAGLLTAAWGPYYSWRRAGERYMPLFPLLSFMYWVFFALSLFWGARNIYTQRGRLSDQSIEHAMLLAVVSVTFLWLGGRTGIGQRLASSRVLDINPKSENTWSYIRTTLLLSVPLTFGMQSQAYLFGSGGRQLFVILTSTVPLAIFVMLFRKWLRRQANHGEFLLIVAFLVSRFLTGIASGWLGTSVSIMIICGIAYLYERQRIPATAVMFVLIYVLFFQAGKEAFRKTFWGERVDATLSQRISFWSSESLRTWELALEYPNSENWRRLADQSLGRVSLLQQTAHVMELTPEVVPYQYGRLYSYMLVTLIPRALWEDKPSVSEANQFYQVAYGLTDPEHLSSVSIAVGTAAESFINFGWWGPFLIMIPLGIFFDYFQHAFLARDSGWVFNAIGIALLPNFLAIESQLAQYLAGIVQCVVVFLLVLWPVLHVCIREGRNAPQKGTDPSSARKLVLVPASRRFL